MVINRNQGASPDNASGFSLRERRESYGMIAPIIRYGSHNHRV